MWFFSRDLNSGQDPVILADQSTFSLTADYEHSGYYFCYGRVGDKGSFIAKRLLKVYGK